MQYLIIGAGPAGVVAAETLRAQDPKSSVVMVGGEPEPAYSRMAIPYYLAKHIKESGTYLRRPDHFEKQGIELRQGMVKQIDPATRRVLLEDGASLDYDKLLLASGSRPVKPPVSGLDDEAIHHCWTLADARKIVKYADPGARVVLMGAGFIGCIIMEALVEREVQLSVVEMGDRMVPRMMDQTAGNLIKRWCQEKGVGVHTSTRVLAVESDPSGQHRYLLRCEPETEIQADLIVVATGVVPNVDYLEGSGLEIDRGVVVNARQQTSHPDIYAAGDVCEGADWNSGAPQVHAIQPVAVETARIAALNMAGHQVEHAGSLGMNVLDTLGLISTSYGQWIGVEGGEQATLLDDAGYRYIQLQFDGDRLVGSITLGYTEHVGVLRGLIQSRARLGDWKARLMENPTRFMEAYLAHAQLIPGA